MTLGTFQNKESLLTVRGSCNKIIHATGIQLDWQDDEKSAFSRYWSGYLHLTGKSGEDVWHINLNIKTWCKSMKFLHEILRSEVDWWEVYID